MDVMDVFAFCGANIYIPEIRHPNTTIALND